MVKPIFETARKIKAAQTADEAFQIAALFLSSPDGGKPNAAQAGTFFEGVREVFEQHHAPDRLKLLLNLTTTLHNSSDALKARAHRMLGHSSSEPHTLKPDT